MGTFTTINLNTVWVITLLLLVIIILSGVKVCNKDNNINTIKNNNRFVDSRYSYISEPFIVPPIPKPTSTDEQIINDFNNLSDARIQKTYDRTLNQERKNLQIKNLTKQVDSIENKILVLQQMW
jgi:hypothetical protein